MPHRDYNQIVGQGALRAENVIGMTMYAFDSLKLAASFNAPRTGHDRQVIVRFLEKFAHAMCSAQNVFFGYQGTPANVHGIEVT